MHDDDSSWAVGQTVMLEFEGKDHVSGLHVGKITHDLLDSWKIYFDVDKTSVNAKSSDIRKLDAKLAKRDLLKRSQALQKMVDPNPHHQHNVVCATRVKPS